MTRSVLTPRLDDEFSKAGAKTYWKRVLPLATINYTDRSGRTRQIDFNDRYLADVKNSFTEGALDNRASAPFVLADKDNAHTMDPERYRGEITAFARENELPEDIRALIAEREGEVPPGLYARTEFPTRKAAKAVIRNPKLPVSMRIREQYERSDGKKFAAVPIHVLGTLDPKIPGLGEWIPAGADLSEYADADVLDLSNESYTEAPVKKKRGTDVQLGTDTLVVPDIETVDPADIVEWDDATLEAFLAQYASLDPEDEDDDQDDDADKGGDDDAEAKLSNEQHADIELAQSQAAEAQRTARDALNRAAQITWSAQRSTLVREGVPPWVLDLAEPVLSRANDTVIDLSNFDEEDINVSELVKTLVDGYKGSVDLSNAAGHGGNDDDDPERPIRDAFSEIEV